MCFLKKRKRKLKTSRLTNSVSIKNKMLAIQTCSLTISYKSVFCIIACIDTFNVSLIEYFYFNPQIEDKYQHLINIREWTQGNKDKQQFFDECIVKATKTTNKDELVRLRNMINIHIVSIPNLKMYIHSFNNLTNINLMLHKIGEQPLHHYGEKVIEVINYHDFLNGLMCKSPLSSFEDLIKNNIDLKKLIEKQVAQNKQFNGHPGELLQGDLILIKYIIQIVS